MKRLIDYYTNLDTKNDVERARFSLNMERIFGYVPVYGPTINDLKFAATQFEHINKAYPGYRWVVEYRDSVLTVVNETLAHNWGFRLRHKMLDNDGKVVRQFAGTLLERYNLTRGAKVDHEVAALKRDARGDAVREG